MAERSVELKKDIVGWGIFGALALFVLGPVAVVIARAGVSFEIRPEDFAAIRFTLLQAFLSALLSVVVAVPVARALARRRFPGRSFVITLLGAPFILPVIVAVLALLAVFGRDGLVAGGLGVFGVSLPPVYGLGGVLLAHVFLNVPLVTRYVLQGWNDIPAERFRLAASLGFRPVDTFRLLEVPMLRSSLPGAFLAVFLICTTSFAVALTLGGGPQATTIELAIYQAFLFDFDLARASQLGLIQLVVSGGAAFLAFRLMRPAQFGAGHGAARARPDIENRPIARLIDVCVLTIALTFFLLPLLALFWRGLPEFFSLPRVVWTSSIYSVAVALVAAGLSVSIALAISVYAALRVQPLGSLLQTLAYLPMALSPLLLGTGLFLAINPVADPRAVAFPVTALVNAVVTLPFAVGVLIPVVAKSEADHGRLATSLGLRGIARLRYLVLPAARPALGFSAGLTAALSIGDLGVITLFAGHEVTTLPLQLYRLMGAYRMEAAMGAAVWLLFLGLFAFWIFDTLGRRRAGT